MNQSGRLKLIAIMFAVDVFLLYAIAYFVIGIKGIYIQGVPAENLKIIIGAFAVATASVIFINSYLKTIYSVKKISPQNQNEKTGGNPFSISLIMLTLSESPAVLGFMAAFFTGSLNYFYPFAIISVFMLSIYWPKD